MLNKASQLLLGRLPDSARDFTVLGSRLGRSVGRKPYTAYYIQQIMIGNHYLSKPIKEATRNLIAELLAEPPNSEFELVQVRVPNGVHVPENTIVLRDATTCICGTSFIPTIWNQINHTRACAIMRARLRARTK